MWTWCFARKWDSCSNVNDMISAEMNSAAAKHHLHHRYSETPPGIAEGALSPQRLRAVHVAERDHHWQREKDKQKNLFWIMIQRPDECEHSSCCLCVSDVLPVCKARNPAMTFWVSSRPFDSSLNQIGAPSAELQLHRNTLERQETVVLSAKVMLLQTSCRVNPKASR